MKQLRYFFTNIWHLLRTGRYKTPKEKLFDAARKQGYTSVYKIPKKYKGKRRFTKAPKIST